jgi:hypothetical protein
MDTFAGNLDPDAFLNLLEIICSAITARIPEIKAEHYLNNTIF